MDWSRQPSLTSLRAFAVLAEHKSYTRAAAALNVSHAAVSQQVGALEAWLGLALVRRSGRSIELTGEGEMLARELAAGFAAIHRGVEAVCAAGAARPVRVSMSPAFATEWLMPRIIEFQSGHPEITLMLDPTAEVVELRPGGIDMAIRYRDRPGDAAGFAPVLVSDMVVIGTPGLVGDRVAGGLSDLLDLPWLQELDTSEVTDWMARRRLRPEPPPVFHHMPGNLIMQAVRRGDGITYTARAFFRDEIRSGAVVVLHAEPLAGRYLLETAPGPSRPAARTFIRWLTAQAETVTAGGSPA